MPFLIPQFFSLSNSVLRSFKFLTCFFNGQTFWSNFKYFYLFLFRASFHFSLLAFINLSMPVHFWQINSLSYKISSLSKPYAFATMLVILSLKCLTFYLSYPSLALFPILLMDKIPNREALSFNISLLGFKHCYSIGIQYLCKSQSPEHYVL